MIKLFVNTNNSPIVHYRKKSVRVLIYYLKIKYLNHNILSFFFQTQMPDPKTFKQHFESKHPKSPMPPELADVQAWSVDWTGPESG